MADVAVLPADAREPDATPSLLVLEAQGMSSDRAHLALLERGDAWEQVAELELDLDRDALEARWLVGLADRRFALVATSPAATEDPGYSVVIGLDIRDGVTPAIVETGRSRIDRAVEDAAAADVDGLGTPELVLGMRPGLAANGCGTTSLLMLDGASLAVRRTIDLPGRLGAGVVGRFDDAAGDDLLAYDARACPPDGAADTGLSAIRLLDGTASPLILGLSGDVEAYPTPVRFRIDGIGRDHALATSDTGLTVIVPGGRGGFDIEAPGAVPLVAGPDAVADGPATRIAWLDDLGLHAMRLPHDAGLGQPTGRTDITLGTVGSERWRMVASSVVDDVRAHGLSSAWLGYVADQACPDLIVPGAILACGSVQLRPGAAWLAMRLVAAMPIEGRRGMLVAAGLGWDPSAGLPASPSPWAAAPPGWWRHGPSTPFALSEVRANDIAYFQDYPTPKATIEANTASDGTTVLPGFTGTRMFVTVAPLAEGQEGPDVAPGRLEGLLRGPRPPWARDGRPGAGAAGQ